MYSASSRAAAFVTASAIVLLGAAVGTASEPTERPNVVFLLADDLGWSDLACYGGDLHDTPHLDALAADSVRFTNAYAASPVCTPTRASLMTGKFPARLHMTIWRESATNRGQRKMLEPLARPDLPLEETTVAERLQQAGYYTAHIGKWHLGDAKHYPQPHGFDVNIGGTLWGAPPSFFYPFRGERYFSAWRYVPDLEPSRPGDYLTDRLTDKAIEIIERQAPGPFFLNLWYHTVHTPIEGKADLVAKYQQRIEAAGDASLDHENAQYAAMVQNLDTNVGRVLAKLESLGIAQRTIVVFMSDNGGYIGTCKLTPGLAVTSNAPLRSGKGSLYEGGIRVPLMVRWPGESRTGTCAEPVFSCDLYPTLLSMTGVEADPDHRPDGEDLSGLIRGDVAQLAQRPLFFHYPHYYSTTSPASAMRDGKWKLIHYYEDDRVELYDLESDLAESNSLADSHPDRVGQLREQLGQWLESVDAQLPEPNPERDR